MPANSSTAVSGSLGKAVVDDSLVARLTQWTLTVSCSESAWGDSDSSGFTVRAAARKDGTGGITGKLDTGTEIYDLFMPEDIVKLVLWQTATAGDYWAIARALITNFTITVDPNTKEVIEWNSDFGCDGAYYAPGESGAPSETLPT